MSRALASDALLTDEERAFADAVREGARALRDVALRVDAEGHPTRRREQAQALYAFAQSLKLQRVALTGRRGYGLGARARAVLVEELARIDAGLAAALFATWNTAALLDRFGTAEVKRTFLQQCLTDRRGVHLLANALTEPDVGSDAQNFIHDGSLRTVLLRRGRQVQLTGEKWLMTNGGAARAYVVCAQREGTHGFQGRTFVVVSPDDPGVAVIPLEKSGLRAALQARLVLTNVVLPAHRILRNPHPGSRAEREMGYRLSLSVSQVEMGAAALGVAQSALELAQEYCDVRVQGGAVLAAHQAVRLRLAEMAGAVGAARAYLWHAAAMIDSGVDALHDGASARAHAAKAARDVGQGALELVSGPALLASHPLDKLRRDAVHLAIGPATTDLFRALTAGRSSSVAV